MTRIFFSSNYYYTFSSSTTLRRKKQILLIFQALMHFERCSSKSFDSCYCRRIGYWKNRSIELFGSLPILPVIVKQHLAFSDAGSGCCCSYCLLLLYICALGLELVLTLLAPFNPCSIQGIEGYNALTSKNSIAFCWSFFLPIWFLKLLFFYDLKSNDY